MNKATLLLILALVVIIFSIVPVGELWLLRQGGFDVIAHLHATASKDAPVKLSAEVFGAAAFVIIQTIVLTWLFVWGAKTLGPVLVEKAVTMLVSYLNRL